MKSKRAREYLDGRYKTMFLMSLSESIKAVEIAEEDMAEKAAKAFCRAKCHGLCVAFEAFGCKELNEFKRKMEE